MKKIILLLLLFCFIFSFSSDVPILFIHGHKQEACPWFDKSGVNSGGWSTWYPQYCKDSSIEHITSMIEILNMNYKGYKPGNPLNCDINSKLKSTNNYTRVIYNYSYYMPDTSMGVIGSNNNLECDYVVIKDGSIHRKNQISQNEWVYGYDYSKDPVNNPPPIDGKSWAFNLAKFIDKVLYATGSSQVDIVAHSMGGLVVRAAMKYYGCRNKIRKVITIGTPNHPFNNPFYEGLWAVVAKDTIWMRVGENWEMSLTSGDLITFTDKNSLESKPFIEFLDSFPTEGLSTIAGNRGIPLNLFNTVENDKVVTVSQVKLTGAVYNAVIYAQHYYKNEKEYSLCTSTFTTEFIKHWMIDNEEIEFTGEITDYGFGVVGNKNNPTSKSIRLLVDGEDANGNNLESYEGILCGVVTSIYEHQNSTVEVGPVKGIDFTNIINNEREPGALRGSPIYLLECPWASNAMSTMYHPKAYFYDMNGLIELPKIEHDYKFNWEDATAPYVTLLPNATALTVFTALNTYNIDWESNDISVRNRLWYARYGSVEIIDSMIPGSVMSKSFRIPPLRSRKSDGITECNLINMNLRFELDDNGYFCQDNKWLTVSTPDWNPDSLRLVYQDEDSIKLAWADRYNLVDKIKRINDGIERDIYPLNTYTDRGFIRGVDNYYEVHSRWVYPNGDSLISENDNNTHKLTVYGIPCNAPKAYPIVCIWQPNDKALIKWLDNSHQSANIKIL